ncbi:MAG: hypothetical protein JKY65_28920 [Planctomycetes bacterium]|nr:hypothetical protein [Planctomycetota bacterium]
MIKGLAEGLLRCAYCHGEAEGLLEGCKCGVLLHADCRRTLGRCPTLGCQTLSVQAVSVLGQASEADSVVLWRLAKRCWRATRGLLLTATISLALFGGMASVVSYSRSPEDIQSYERAAIGAACHEYRSTVGRWPETLEYLVAAETPEGPCLDEDFFNWSPWRYSIMWRDQEAWLAIEIKEDEGLTTRLVERLFVREVATSSVNPKSTDDIQPWVPECWTDEATSPLIR